MEKKRLYDAIMDWMEHYKKNSVKPSTYDRLMVSLDSLRKYEISDIFTDELDTIDLQDYLNQLVADGYALTTIKKQYHLLSGYILYANLNGDILRPIHKGVNLPSESAVKKRKREVVSYSHEEQEALKDVLYSGESPAYYSAILMLETGMRIGEVLALCWTDIDWKRRAIRISKTLVRLGDCRNSYVQDSAKSFTSNRTIPMSKNAYELLDYLKRIETSCSPFIFHNRRGDYLSYETVRWWIKKACLKADVPYYGQHVFRHTFATNCYERGCDVKMLSKMLGHSDVTITYNIYIHLFGDALEEMRSVVG